MKNRPSSQPRTIQSVDRAMQIVDLLASCSAGHSLSIVAREMGLKPQTVQSLLRTLECHGLVSQAGRGEPYTLGPRVHEWSRRWLAGADWAAAAGSIVAELGDRLGEYVVLSQLRGDSLVHLVEKTPARSLVVTPSAESPEHLHTMATANVLLAWLGEEERARIVADLPMLKRGPKSITDRGVFLQRLGDVRRDGYVECIDEASEGVVALAVPVDTARGEGTLALGMALPKVRYRKREDLLAELRLTASKAGQACQARTQGS